jgi:hypothetical protein
MVIIFDEAQRHGGAASAPVKLLRFCSEVNHA